jgi:hypothetical protein
VQGQKISISIFCKFAEKRKIIFKFYFSKKILQDNYIHSGYKHLFSLVTQIPETMEELSVVLTLSQDLEDYYNIQNKDLNSTF